MRYFYDRSGRPIDEREWLRLFADASYKFVDQTEVDSFFVSTVWLGLDHNWGRDPLHIFETMIFFDTWDAEYLKRWSTEAEAMEAHMKIVDMFQRGLLLELLERIDAGTILQHAM